MVAAAIQRASFAGLHSTDPVESDADSDPVPPAADDDRVDPVESDADDDPVPPAADDDRVDPVQSDADDDRPVPPAADDDPVDPVQSDAEDDPSGRFKPIFSVRRNPRRNKQRTFSSDWCVPPAAEAYCVCRQPYGGSAMIQCDNCEEWYHCKCMAVDPQVCDSEVNKEDDIVFRCGRRGCNNAVSYTHLTLPTKRIV